MKSVSDEGASNSVEESVFEATPDIRRRVKLYVLNEERQWDDRGTGHVTSIFSERLEGTALLVRSETDGSLLLESKIELDTAYQKQQETLIVWSEGDKYDLALSFQGKAGCDEIWEKICYVQGKDPSVDITQEVLDSDEERFDLDDCTPALELPPCELAHLEELAQLCSTSLASPIRRDKLGTAVENGNYISRLLELFHLCEDLENTEGLHHLYDIIKSLFLLNKTSLLEVLLAEDNLMDVVGLLEYDPSQPEPKKHRDYLRTKTCFREVIPITNKDLKAKIHQTYRVTYIHDVVFPAPSILEDNMLSALSSFIFFNKVEIVNLIQEDDRFLRQVFQMLTDDETDDAKRRDIVLFLKEFCAFSQTLQQPSRENFFKTLSGFGILESLERILTLDDPSIKSAAVDIFSYVVEFSPSMVREFIMQEVKTFDDEDLLINLVIEQMIGDSDPELGGAFQLLGVIRILLDPENMLATTATRGTEKTEFLTFFYKHCMHVLCAPLLANTADGAPSKDDYVTAVQLNLLLELLCFCVEHHSFHACSYIIARNLLARVLVLLQSRHTFLALTAVRFLRRLIGCKEERFTDYLIKNRLFKPIVECFVRNGEKYNLLNSAIIDLFEFIKTEDIKPLVKYVVEQHFSAFEGVEYVQTFKTLRIRYEQQMDRERCAGSKPGGTATAGMLSVTSTRAHDEEDEDEIWFEQEDPSSSADSTNNSKMLDDFELRLMPPQRVRTEEEEPAAPVLQRRPINININLKPTLIPMLSSQQHAPAPGSPLPQLSKASPLQKIAAEPSDLDIEKRSATGLNENDVTSTSPDSLMEASNDIPHSAGDAPEFKGLPNTAEIKSMIDSAESAKTEAAVVKKPGWHGLVAYEADSDEELEGVEEDSVSTPSQSDDTTAPEAKRVRLQSDELSSSLSS